MINRTCAAACAALFLVLAACGPGDPVETGPSGAESSENSETAATGETGETGETGSPESASEAVTGDDQPTSDSSAPAATTSIRFDDVTEQSGVDYVHVAGRSPDRLMPEIMSGGVGVVDVNRDGAPDLIFVNSGFVGRPRRSADSNRLYINLGDGTFRDATEEWGLPTPTEGYGNGIAVGDVDGDGWTDLFFTGYGAGEMLVRNTGERFEDITASSGIAPDGGWGTSAGFFDIENDGNLDLWLQRFVDFTPETAEKCYSNDVHIYCTPNVASGVPDRLLRGAGDGTFVEFGEAAGISTAPNLGLALVITDIDADGDQDVYIANDISRNILWINDGQGGFVDDSRLRGLAFGSTGQEEAGMGTDVTDVDGDGDLDVSVANFQDEPTSIYIQGEGGIFNELSDRAGVGMTSRTRLSWGIDFFDADNDGDEDLLVANGHLWDNAETFASGVNFAQTNSLFENLGDGTLVDVSPGAGAALALSNVSRGLAGGDFDGDGRLDFVVANNDGAPVIARNMTATAGNFVNLWLEGSTANRSAIGARVVARVGEKSLLREVRGTSSYLSQSDLRVHFGLGDADAADITIQWPGGSEQVLEQLPAGAFYHVVEGAAPVAYVPGGPVIAP